MGGWRGGRADRRPMDQGDRGVSATATVAWTRVGSFTRKHVRVVTWCSRVPWPTSGEEETTHKGEDSSPPYACNTTDAPLMTHHTDKANPTLLTQTVSSPLRWFIRVLQACKNSIFCARRAARKLRSRVNRKQTPRTHVGPLSNNAQGRQSITLA